jgi:hypothetical protein
VKRLLILIAALAHAQVRPDTQALVASLKSIRGEPGLSAERSHAISRALLEWVDMRLRNRAHLNALNDELQAAGAFGWGNCEDATMCDYTGFISELRAEPVPGAENLFALHLGIGTTCGYDQTIVLYQRKPWARIGWLNHGDVQRGVPYNFSSFKVSEVRGRWTIASAEFSQWCTSMMISVSFRISEIRGTTLTDLLNRDLSARLDEGSPVTLEMTGSSVTFHYLTTATGGLLTRAVERYTVSDSAATLAPF